MANLDKTNVQRSPATAVTRRVCAWKVKGSPMFLLEGVTVTVTGALAVDPCNSRRHAPRPGVLCRPQQEEQVIPPILDRIVAAS